MVSDIGINGINGAANMAVRVPYLFKLGHQYIILYLLQGPRNEDLESAV